jgi:hypothetical protein
MKTFYQMLLFLFLQAGVKCGGAMFFALVLYELSPLWPLRLAQGEHLPAQRKREIRRKAIVAVSAVSGHIRRQQKERASSCTYGASSFLLKRPALLVKNSWYCFQKNTRRTLILFTKSYFSHRYNCLIIAVIEKMVMAKKNRL